MKYFCLILAYLLISCAGCASDFAGEELCPAGDHVAAECYQSQLIRVFVDNTFEEKRQIELFEAFGQWSIKTKNRVRFDIAVVPTQALKTDATVNNTFYVYNRAPADPQFSGYTVWSHNANGAVIELSPNIGEQYFIPVALHEIGHALGLNHYKGIEPSIMNESLRNGLNITCLDIRSFCQLWDCLAKCD